jgi:hypothetical protein
MNLLKSVVYRWQNLPENQANLVNRDLNYLKIVESRAKLSKNPLTKSYGKSFSQNDEDRILNEILKRINLDLNTFVEFGPGNGLENNTVSLLLKGWKGLWIGGEDLEVNIPKNNKLNFFKEWINLEKLESYLSLLKDFQPAIISMDLDGNDYYFMEYLLSNSVKPAIIIQEYNGLFPMEIHWIQEYNPNHIWDGSSYYGASLLAYKELFAKHEYSLLCCNLTGVNSFFVKNEFLNCFLDIPKVDMDKFVFPLGYPNRSQSMPNKRIIQEIMDNL